MAKKKKKKQAPSRESKKKAKYSLGHTAFKFAPTWVLYVDGKEFCRYRNRREMEAIIRVNQDSWLTKKIEARKVVEEHYGYYFTEKG